MLENIHIKNAALIEDESIDFEEGLNILSGETGAGKSMVIASINFALGERANKDFIREGADAIKVEALFSANSETLNGLLEENGVTAEEDGSLLISRSFSQSGKNLCKINGSTVTLSILKNISGLLADVHGQREHQALLNPLKQAAVLDKFCGEDFDALLATLADEHSQYKAAAARIKALSGDGVNKEDRLEILNFQKNEIETANLKKGEEEELIARRKILQNGEKINRLSAECAKLLRDDTGSASEKTGVALNKATELSQILDDAKLKEVCDNLSAAVALIDDAAMEINAFSQGGDVEEELYQAEERLDLIRGLKRKYNGGVEDILARYDKITEEIKLIETSDEKIRLLREENEKRLEKMKTLCEKISARRRETARRLSDQITGHLRDLQMQNARLKISVEKKKELTPLGWDNVEFLIAPNSDEGFKPLAQIASGGEISRVMLALKTTLADADEAQTFIFDEIDTGVSGVTAGKVGQKMSRVARGRQIICITHLPQIAAMGDCNFMIEKSDKNGKTTTNVKKLNEEEICKELARLMGGENTDALMEAAAELRELSLCNKTQAFS